MSYIITLPTNDIKMDVNLFFRNNESKDFIGLINNSIKYADTDYFKDQRIKKKVKHKSNFDYPIENIVRELLPEAIPTNYGYKCVCPFHGDSNPSFAIYTDTNKFYCFGIGCGLHGNSVTLYKMLQNNRGKALTYAEAVVDLSNGIR